MAQRQSLNGQTDSRLWRSAKDLNHQNSSTAKRSKEPLPGTSGAPIGGEVSPPAPQETRLGDKPQSGFLFEADRGTAPTRGKGGHSAGVLNDADVDGGIVSDWWYFLVLSLSNQV